MGLTRAAVGRGALEGDTQIRRRTPEEKIIALAGNPNVGKSTVFNALTGMNQHTGNWPGKTVARAEGRCRSPGHPLLLVDIPGTYSLFAHSPEEEVARDFLASGLADATVVVCDATCLSRNLTLVLQALELSPRTVVCVNLMDEAERRHIHPDLALLSERLGVPVVGTVARKKKSLVALLAAIDLVLEKEPKPLRVRYPSAIEEARATLTPLFSAEGSRAGFFALSLLVGSAIQGEEEGVLSARELTAPPQIAKTGGACVAREEKRTKPPSPFSEEKADPSAREEVCQEEAREEEGAPLLRSVRARLATVGLSGEVLRDAIAAAPARLAEELCRGVVREGGGYSPRDRRLDRILTGRVSAYPVMLLLLLFVFFLTIIGANYPSAWLSALFARGGEWLSAALLALGTPPFVRSLLLDGVYLVLSRVVAVMLPPMAIFFPLFTLLEDSGYLPRIAYNLDRPFCACRACGKQALCMCMGFGCNAAGVVGARIIDSPRERLLAILTNSFVPCNGRFPALLALISMFFIGGAVGLAAAGLSALWLTVFILLAVGATLLVTRFLSGTLLRGLPSSFALELPSYRRPQVGRVILRSLLDRTLSVLGRAVVVAIPAGAIIWLAANLSVGEGTLLSEAAHLLDPIGRFLGMDGVILLAFLLGMPANEIVLPLITMAYLSAGSPVELTEVAAMRELFLANGWTPLTAVCTALFFLFHWPCTTTTLTVRRETGSLGYTALAVLCPTVFGVLLCAVTAAVGRLLFGG